ncbi:MAG TPA: WG repeat-containing protein, partial [Armatimonadota bacterium]
CIGTVGMGAPALPEIFTAVKAGNVVSATQIVEKHPEQVNATDALAETPLLLAARNGQTEMVAMLLAHHASPAYQDAAGKLALTYATEHQHAEIVKLLEAVVSLPEGQCYWAAFKRDGLWGFIDQAGRVTLAPQWQGWGFDAQTRIEIPPHFSEGLAAMRGRQQWGYIDRTGKWAIPAQYDGLGDFYHGVAPFQANQAWGLLDQHGEEVCPAKYPKMQNFSDGLAWVGENFIDVRGTPVLPQNNHERRCNLYEPFRDGSAIAYSGRDTESVYGPVFITKTPKGYTETHYDRLDCHLADDTYVLRRYGRMGLVQRDGTILIPLEYDQLDPIGSNLVRVNQRECYGVVTKTGQQILPVEYEDIGQASGGLIWVKKDKKYAAVDLLGQPRVAPRVYQGVKPWGQDRAAVKVDGAWMFIDAQGQPVGNSTFDDAGTFCADRAPVLIGAKWGFIDLQGKLVIPCDYQAAPHFEANGHAWVSVGNKRGVIDTSGSVTLPAVIDAAKLVAKDRIAVLANGRWGLLNDQFHVIFQPRYGYLSIEPFDAFGLARVVIENGERYGFINREGVLVIALPSEALAYYHQIQ